MRNLKGATLGSYAYAGPRPAEGREPAAEEREARLLRRTLGVFGRTRADVDRKLDGAGWDGIPAGVIVGTENEVVERLGRLAEAGVQRVMAKWLEVDDIDALWEMAHSVLPQL